MDFQKGREVRRIFLFFIKFFPTCRQSMQCHDANQNVRCYHFTLNTSDCLIVSNNISELNAKQDFPQMICFKTKYPVASDILLTAALCHSLPEIPPLTHQPWSCISKYPKGTLVFLLSSPLFPSPRLDIHIYLDFFLLILRKMSTRSSSLVESILISISSLFYFEFIYFLCKIASPSDKHRQAH